MALYTLTIKQIIENKIPIFDFSYPLANEHKERFEKLFIDHFYFDEIGFETVGRFKHQLKKELTLIMPTFNKLYMSQGLEQRILDNYDVTENFEKETNNKSTGNIKGADKTTTATTPVRRTNIETIDYIDDITKNDNSVTSDGIEDGKEKWTRTMTGNIGIQTDADAVMKYESSLRNIDEELLNRLSILFMGVY